ncbi:MAG: hypothetical protein RIM72_22160 [Alphaproteobacteria bacterium]
MIRAERLCDAPIIHSGLSDSLGHNINGPSLVKRPDWAPGPGRYMLYFAHHQGKHIRLAFADALAGPWTIHEPGVLPLHETPFSQQRLDLPQPDWALEAGTDNWIEHLASPDVHLNHRVPRFEMLVHGLCDDAVQKTYLAVSADGLDWTVEGPAIDQTYLRRFEHDGCFHAVGLYGQLLRGLPDGGYALGPNPLPDRIRHVGILKRGTDLHVLFTRYEDAPERILHIILKLEGDWQTWRTLGEPVELLRPEVEWEGASLPVEPGKIGATGFVNALRDPFLFEDDGKVYLIYAGGGEAALGLAEVTGL